MQVVKIMEILCINPRLSANNNDKLPSKEIKNQQYNQKYEIKRIYEFN
jgi:hypothetical protein